MAAKTPTKATAATGGRGRGKLLRIRNTKRAQWFFPFPVNDEEAALAKGIVGLKVEPGEWRTTVEGKPTTVPTKICTLAIGDDRADVKRGELMPEIEIPIVLWDALLRVPVHAKAIEGLCASGEIATYESRAAA